MDPQSTTPRPPRKRCICGCFLPDVVNPAYVCGGCAAIAAGQRHQSHNKADSNGMWKGDAAGWNAKHGRAWRGFSLPAACEVCGAARPRDRHHKNGDPGDNNRENVIFCCRRCHMTLDGRLEALVRRPARRGYAHAGIKLTSAQEEEIRTLYAAGGWTQTKLGERYGVAHATISRICRREGFRGVQDPSSG